MKKRILVILIVLVLVSIPMFGCENSFSKERISQETDYLVSGNGGNAVQYGDHIYFINGFRDYSSDEVKLNKWNDVVKGALYRVKLLGEKNDNQFAKKTDPATGLEFSSTPYVIDKNGYEQYLSSTQYDTLRNDVLMIETDLNVDLKDNDDYEPDIIEEFFYIDDVAYRVDNVELVSPKVIGTSGYADGGLFIFDNYIYYASPNNQKNKSGEIQSGKTDFFRTSLNGKKTEKIYTTKSDDSSSSPYKFYKQGSFVYLVALDDKNIISVKMTDKRIVSKSIIADNATGAYFPDKAIYNAKDNKTDSVEDFIYYTRDINDDDGKIKTGNVIEAMRPNGECRFELIKSGSTSKIECVRDGLFFYRMTNALGRESLYYTNMHDALLAYNYKANKSDEFGVSPYTELVVNKALEEISSEYESIYCFRPNANIDQLDNNIYVLGFTSNAVYIIDHNKPRVKILNEKAILPLIDGNTMYFSNSSGAYYYINIFEHYENNSPILIESQAASGVTIRNSIVAGYFVFMGTIDGDINAYAKFYPINSSDTAKSIFIGEVTEEELDKTPDEA